MEFDGGFCRNCIVVVRAVDEYGQRTSGSIFEQEVDQTGKE